MTGYRSASSAVSSSGSATVHLPSGLAAGDIVLVAVELAGFGGGLTAVLTPPPGFGLLQTTTGSTANARLYWKKATASEPSGGWVWTSSSSDLFIVDALAYSGYVAVDKSAVSGGLPCPVVTTVYDGEKIVYFRTAYQGGGPTTTLQPAGTTNRPGVGGLTEIISAAELDQTTAGATPSGETWTGSPGGATFTVTLTSNVAPNAPTITNPANGSTVDRTSDLLVVAPFSDPDPADSQSKIAVRYNNGGAWTTVTAITPHNYLTIPALTFAAGSYELQAKSTDSHGLDSTSWGPSVFITAGTPPAGPTVTYPAPGATVGFSDHVDWSYPSQDAYRVRVLGDVSGAADPTNVIYDSGVITDTAARTAALTFPGLNSTWVHVMLSVKISGLFSSEIDTRVFVSYSKPPAPAVALTVGTSAISASWTTPAPSGGQPAVDHVDVFVSDDDGATFERRATNQPTNGSWTYETPASGAVVAFLVQAVAGSGVTADNDPIVGTEIYPSASLYPSTSLYPMGV